MKIKKRLKLSLAAAIFLITTGCAKSTEPIQPKIHYTVSETRLKNLPAAFAPLSDSEKAQEWGKEYFIGQKLAQKLDLYRAVTAFKRAEILIPGYLKKRLQEIQYYTVLSYYIGGRYEDVIEAFQTSDLLNIDPEFTAYRDLLIILHESYNRLKEFEKAALVCKLLEEQDQGAALKIKISHAIAEYDTPALAILNAPKTKISSETSAMLSSFQNEKKSVRAAQTLNAVCPGAGYLYLGQKQSAITAFLMNGLFIYASYYFLHEGNLAAGIITTSLEAGWYFGGITGAKESAKLYNERLYENKATYLMQQNELHPVLSLTHSF